MRWRGASVKLVSNEDGNARSMYEKLGFKHEGTAREELFHNGRFWDGYMYGMLDREWKDIKANNKEQSKR